MALINKITAIADAIREKTESEELMTLQEMPNAIRSIGGGLKIVTWADGTDEEIKAMLDAHYAGEIDIHDYWNIGDERVVHLTANSFQPEQDVTFVLVEDEETTFPLVNLDADPAFVVNQKNCLVNKMTLHSSNSPDFGNSSLHSFLNNQYFESLPDGIKNIIQEFSHTYEVPTNRAPLTPTIIDKISIPHLSSLSNSTYAYVSHNKKWKYTTDITGNYPIKYLGNSENAVVYWTSTAVNRFGSYRTVTVNRTTYPEDASTNSLGVSPFFFI